jgi:hypothetical protein
MIAAAFFLSAIAVAVPPRPDAGVEALIDQAQAVPPEFGAEALLRVVESGRISDPVLFRKLIESSFEKAAAAREPVARKVLPAFKGANLPSLRAEGYALGLDRLSLQTRAVRDMQRLDAKRALALFEDIPYPAVQWRKCSQPLYEDVSAYYQTLAAVAPQAGRDADKLALTALARIQSPVELGPAGQMIQTLSVPVVSRDALLISLASISERVGSEACLDASAPNTVELFGKAPAVSELQRPEIEDLRLRWQSLMYGTTSRMLPEDKKANQEWREAYAALIRDVEALQPLPDSSEVETLERRCVFLAMLYMAAPAGREQDAMLQRYLLVLRTSPLENEDPLFWYSRVRAFYRSARPNDPVQREKLFAALEASGSPMLSLYARLERTLPAF